MEKPGTLATFANRKHKVPMVINQIQNRLAASMPQAAIIRMDNDKLIVRTMDEVEGIHTTIHILSETSCLFEHPAAPYETSGQAEVFLDHFNESTPASSGITFLDDKISKCIMAVFACRITDDEWLIDHVYSILSSFVQTVKTIRNSLAKVILDTISPAEIIRPERSLLYLSLMQVYDDEAFSRQETGIMPIDWADVRTLWRRSQTVILLPRMDGSSYEQLLEKILATLGQYLRGRKDSVICYFGLPPYADGEEGFPYFSFRDRIRSIFGCQVLDGFRFYLAKGSHITALIAIFKA